MFFAVPNFRKTIFSCGQFFFQSLFVYYCMQVPLILAIVISILFVGCIILLLHHGYSHRYNLHGCEQYFQLSDVGNFHSCSHEMWIIALGCILSILGICALIMHYAS